jgi:hypothetical protein
LAGAEQVGPTTLAARFAAFAVIAPAPVNWRYRPRVAVPRNRRHRTFDSAVEPELPFEVETILVANAA